MDNHNLQWRIWAKVVAYVDLITSILFLLATLLMAFLAGAATQVIATSKTDDIPEGAGAIAWFIWLAVVIMALATFVSLWAAIQLIKATELGRDAKEAHKFCHLWQVVCIVSIVLDIICKITMGTYISLAINVLVRGVFLFVVYRFMQELETIVIGTPHRMNQKV